MARLVVFKEAADLVDLRELLYGDIEEQNRGLSRAKAYEVRGHLPPSVHVTCLLISAIHSDIPGTDFYAIRQTYAMSLIRFVNEMLDVYQVGRAVVPLHILASQMGLPSAFVELRHAATHEDLPSVYLLRQMANRALEWLWENFWSKQGTGIESSKRVKPNENPPENEYKGSLKDLFREWRRMKRGNAASTPPRAMVTALESAWEQDSADFCDVCLNQNVMLPHTDGPTSKRVISQIIAMWMPLFQSMERHTGEELSTTICFELSNRDWPLRKNEDKKFPVLEAWALALAPYLTRYGASIISKTPRPWNAQILAINARENNDADLHKVAEEMAFLTGTEIVKFTSRQSSTTEGWERMKNWTPRPLGT